MALTRPRASQIYDIDYKQATRVVTVANITLAGGAPNQVDGVNLSLNDRVLVTGQSTLSQNGIYYVTTLGSGSNGTWSRSLDTNNTGEILTGTIVMVTEGNIFADTQWKLITDGVIDVGVTDQVWTQNYSANSISGGNSNVVVNSNANVTISSAGVPNVLTISSTGIVVSGNIVPSSNVTYSLGTTTQRFSNLWLSNSTIYLGNVTVGATANQLTVNGANVVTATANSDIQTSGNISVTGNVTSGNINTAGTISATGNITGNYFLGNVFYANGITASKIYSGTSEVNVVSSGGNVNVTVGGTSNVAVFSTEGEYITGLLNVTGNTTSGNLLTGGLLSATGNVIGGNITTVGMVSATGNIDGNYLNANIYYATGFSASRIYLGNSEVNVTSSGGNVNVSVGGTSNVAVYAATGEYITGVMSASGNVTGGNILTGGLISVAGTITSGNIYTGGLSLTGNTITSSGTTLTIDPNGSGGIDGAVVIAGNLSVQGNVTFIDSNVITTNEKSITLANNVNTGSLADGAGIDVGNTTIAYWRFNNATTSWQSNIGLTPAANATLNLGGTSNYWATIYATGATLSGNITSGNVLTGGLISSTGNITGGNLLTSGILSVTGNITTAGNYLGNGAALSNIFAFSNILVTGQNTINASSIASSLTFTAGANMVITTDSANSTITIAYNNTSSSSIFATGGDMGLVTEAVTSSEDLGLVIDTVSVSYDLGGVVSASGLIYPSQLVLPEYTPGTLPSASPAAQFIYLSTSTIGAMTAFSDGTNWRFTSTGGIVS